MPITITNDLVMGLHWAPVPDDARERPAPANLDALCLLLDEKSRRLEVIRPGHLKNANGSVVHTGDSRTGASLWDDERVFVFVEALPQHVHEVVFGVVSHDRPFSEVAGASCHISDLMLEEALLRVHLDTLGAATECCIATLRRGAAGWILQRRAPQGASLTELLTLPPPRCAFHTVDRGDSART
jgi:stress response protein SCP2